MSDWSSDWNRRRNRRASRRDDAVLFALYFLCVVLLVLSRIGHGTINDARGRLSDLSAPLLETAATPVVEVRRTWDKTWTYFNLTDELDRLQKETEALREWEWRAKQLERKVEHLRALLNAVEEPGLHYVSGNVIADARGPFVRSALINLGREQGVKVGYAVINGDGLVGRTVETGETASRVLLLNDLNSRIPVLVGPAGVRAIVSGDNSAELRLEFLPEGATLYPGDEVYTSGSDGLLPRGLRVGAVTGTPGNFKVRPLAKLNDLDFVSVLFFDAPSLRKTDLKVGASALSTEPPFRAERQGRKTSSPAMAGEPKHADAENDLKANR